MNSDHEYKTTCITYDGVCVCNGRAKVSKVEMAVLHVLWACTWACLGVAAFVRTIPDTGVKICERGKGKWCPY